MLSASGILFCVKKSRRRTTAQTELLLLILFIPRPEWSVQYVLLYASVPIMKPLRHETDLVLSKTECEEGKRFRRDNLPF